MAKGVGECVEEGTIIGKALVSPLIQGLSTSAIEFILFNEVSVNARLFQAKEEALNNTSEMLGSLDSAELHLHPEDLEG